MSNSKLISYITSDFQTKSDMKVGAEEWQAIIQEMLPKFKKAGAIRQTVSQIWNKEGVARVGILFEYRDEKAFVACQTLLDKYHAPQVKTFVNKVVGSRGIVLHEFTSEDFN